MVITPLELRKVNSIAEKSIWALFDAGVDITYKKRILLSVDEVEEYLKGIFSLTLIFPIDAQFHFERKTIITREGIIVEEKDLEDFDTKERWCIVVKHHHFHVYIRKDETKFVGRYTKTECEEFFDRNYYSSYRGITRIW